MPLSAAGMANEHCYHQNTCNKCYSTVLSLMQCSMHATTICITISFTVCTIAQYAYIQYILNTYHNFHNNSVHTDNILKHWSAQRVCLHVQKLSSLTLQLPVRMHWVYALVRIHSPQYCKLSKLSATDGTFMNISNNITVSFIDTIRLCGSVRLMSVEFSLADISHPVGPLTRPVASKTL